MTAYVGSWTTAARNATGPGLSVYRIDPVTFGWDLIQILEADNGDPATPPGPDTLPESPSFLALYWEQLSEARVIRVRS